MFECCECGKRFDKCDDNDLCSFCKVGACPYCGSRDLIDLEKEK